MFAVYYKMQLDNMATASFCNLPKDFFGTLQDFQSFLDTATDGKRYVDTRNAFAQFIDGDSSAQHTVCCNKTPVLRLASLTAKERFELNATEWDHKNAYGCIYKMRAERISAEQILIKCEDLYYRCVRPTFYGLQYKTKEDADWEDVGNNLQVNEGIIQITEKEYKFRLFVVEQGPVKLDEALEGMWFPEKLNFKTACDEIFGNN